MKKLYNQFYVVIACLCFRIFCIASYFFIAFCFLMFIFPVVLYLSTLHTLEKKDNRKSPYYCLKCEDLYFGFDFNSFRQVHHLGYTENKIVHLRHKRKVCKHYAFVCVFFCSWYTMHCSCWRTVS